jgi:hypothetical protein
VELALIKWRPPNLLLLPGGVVDSATNPVNRRILGNPTKAIPADFLNPQKKKPVTIYTPKPILSSL